MTKRPLRTDPEAAAVTDMARRALQKPKMREVMAWGGFTDGKLDWRFEFASEARITVFAIYKTRGAAKKQYEDVRRVKITEVPARKRK